ncbi:MAG: thioesterase family protein [Novosphingobium sp.]
MRSFDQGFVERKWTHDIAGLLAMEQVGDDRFRCHFSQPNAYRALFGGQIVAQALAAADRTVATDRAIHSLHSYFLRAGVGGLPIDYAVERIRDGGRFSTRRVVASQGEHAIFTMECSYRTSIEGFSHQWPATVPFDPEAAIDGAEFREMLGEERRDYAVLFEGRYPVEVRLPGTLGFTETISDARRHYWLRAPGSEAIDDPAVHRQIFAFLSDFMLVGAPLSPHVVALPGPHLFVASIDHSIWFHRQMRCDDWLLFETEGPNAEKGVNLARALVYNRAGELVASLAQEALQYPMPQG